MDQDVRDRILARRARFVAAALVAAGFVSVERRGEGQTSVAPAPSASEPELGPSICLSDDPMPEPRDAGPDVPETEPQVCLSIVREHPGCHCDTPGRG